MSKPGRPRKRPDVAKSDYLELRLDSSEKETFKTAAEAAGMPVSGWVRDRLRRAAKKELEGLSLPVAFLDRLSS